MNDRFKFRAWYYDKDDENDSDNNKMFYNAQDTYDCLCGDPPLKASSFGCIIDDERWVVEQCTGLKDKNGKLIYEGDIVKLSSDGEAVCPVVWDNEETGFCVKYEKELYRFNPYKKYNLIEVIGNIHENSDLLEADNAD